MKHVTDAGEEILRVLCGSRAYGLETAESDFDYHGVFVVPTSRILAIGEKYSETAWVEGQDQDNTAWELRHFLELALHCNPTVLETFVAPVEVSTQLGDELRGLFPFVLSRKRVYDAFRGYASNQRKKMFEPVGGVQATDRMLKAAVAYLRSLYHGICLLDAGTYSPRIEDDELKAFLLGLKRSVKPDFGAIVTRAMALEDELTAAYAASWMQTEAAMGAINDFLLRVRRERWDA